MLWNWLAHPLIQWSEAGLSAPAAVYVTLYCALLAIVLIAAATALFRLRRHDDAAAFWTLVALLAVVVLLTRGDDSVHHILRVEALAAQLASGLPGVLITNSATGEVIPVFLYYSIVPYLPVLALVLLGIPAAFALQLALLAAFLVFALQSWRLVQRFAAPDAGVAAIFLLCANYVFMLWLSRAALGEIMAYCLIPLAIRLALDNRKFLLGVVLFLQACAHPIVFAYSLLGIAAGAITLSPRPLPAQLRIFIAPVLAAVLLSAPFWAPPALMMGDVLGIAGLPVKFAHTFQTPLELLDPLSAYTVGPVLVALCLWAGVVAWRRRDGRIGGGVAMFFILLLSQSSLARAALTHVPILNQTQFIWRLMFPTAIAGFAAVLAFILRGAPPRPALSAAAAVAISLVVLLLLLDLHGTVRSIDHAITARQPSAASYFRNAGTSDDNIWGVHLFSPDYRRLPESCPPDDRLQQATYAALRQGVPAQRDFMAVAAAPLAAVRYLAAGEPVTLSHCGDALLLGPLAPGAIVSVDETRLDLIAKARYLLLLAFAACMLAVLLRRVMRPPRASHPPA